VSGLRRQPPVRVRGGRGRPASPAGGSGVACGQLRRKAPISSVPSA